MSNLILFTGAGFTHNFGAPLASQMMSIIFNYRHDADLSKKAMHLLEDSRNYENVYANIMDKEQYKDDRNPFSDIIKHAYNDLDHIVRNIRCDDIENVSSKLLKRFHKVFTLNQDLFVERYHQPGSLGDIGVTTPGLDKNNAPLNKKPFDVNKHYIEISDEHKLPEGLAPCGKGINYFKLHGSQNWKNHEGHLIILGGDEDKLKKINNIPLLKDYMAKFKSELKKENIKLLIIGYGFQDNHINDLLSNAHDQVEFHIICPIPIANFYDNVICSNKPGIKERQSIWSHSYYYECNLHELMQGNGMGEYYRKSLSERYFGEHGKYIEDDKL